MSDESLSPDHELANAYLDGHADVEEQARVESSPELLALVASYQVLRARVAAVPAPSDASREAAVAAALAAIPLVAPPPNVVSLERRRWSRGLTAAAAVVLLGVAGVAVTKAIGGSGSDSSTAEPAAAQNIAGEKTSATDAGGDAGVASDTVTDSEFVVGGPENTDGGSQSTVGAAGGATETTAAGTATIGGGAVDTTPAPPISSIDGGASPVPEYDDPAQLRSLPEPTGEVQPNFVFDCPLTNSQIIEAEISWRNQPAVVVRDTVSGVITVLSPECTELVSVPSQP
jgi:hypothetical protein